MGNCINGATPNSVTMVATNESQLVTSPSAYYASYSCSGATLNDLLHSILTQ